MVGILRKKSFYCEIKNSGKKLDWGEKFWNEGVQDLDCNLRVKVPWMDMIFDLMGPKKCCGPPIVWPW